MFSDETSALHVAGHAVVGELVGFECLAVTIRWTDQNLGVCRGPAMPDPVFNQLQFRQYSSGDPEFEEIKDWVIRRTKAYLAGAVSQDLATGSFDLAWLTTDLNMISVITRNVFGVAGSFFDESLTIEMYYDIDLGMEIEDLGRVVSRVRELWEDEVRSSLEENRVWLDAVASALLEQKSLTGEIVRSFRPHD